MMDMTVLLSEQDREVFELSGQGKRAGLGKRPALMVIDVSYAFCGEKSEPIVESVKKWRTSCGSIAWEALPRIARLLETARARNLPIIYTTGQRRQDGWDSGAWRWKNRRVGEGAPDLGVDGYDIMPQIAPESRDIVIRKLKPSAFFATPLQGFLTQLGVDSLIIAGTTTSGCVRGTVVDAFSLNYKVSVVGDCCFDRYEASHIMSLFDMNAKYADVISTEEADAALKALPDGLFELPGR